jgi:SAM-dependent methyltransferase
VPVYVGTIETQNIARASLDAIVANDVMEHLPDPISTFQCCTQLLKPDGVLIIQMPCYPEAKNWDELRASQDRFVDHTKEPEEHLYLYSKRAARLFFERLGFTQVHFEKAMFDHYDMYFAASRQAVSRNDDEHINTRLLGTPTSRLILAMMDLARQEENVHRVYQEDRKLQLEAISTIGARLAESEIGRKKHLQIFRQLIGQLRQLRERFMPGNSEQAAQRQQIEAYEKLLAAKEAERSAQGASGANLEETLAASMQTLEHILQDQQNTIRAQQNALAFLQGSCLAPLGPIQWRQLPKKLAKLMLPLSWRRKIRQHLLPPAASHKPARR